MSYILVDTTIWIDFFREKEKTKQATTKRSNRSLLIVT